MYKKQIENVYKIDTTSRNSISSRFSVAGRLVKNLSLILRHA